MSLMSALGGENHRLGPDRRWWCFIVEHHTLSCRCSYCYDHKWDGSPFFGFKSPQCKAFNAWRVLLLVTARGRHYVRWTAFWKERPRNRR